MCLRPTAPAEVPPDTAQVAHAAFPKGHRYLQLRQEFGALFTDEQFAALFAPVGKPALAPGRLALICVLQFAEGLSDRQAAEAVQSRIDWKYLLGLSLTDPGLDASVLCEFRARLVEQGAEALLFEHLLACCRDRGWLTKRGEQRTDSTQVLAALRTLNRLEMVGETVRGTLELLAGLAPDWLVAHAQPGWGERYARSFSAYRLPAGEKARQALAEQIGQDGFHLLTALFAEAQQHGPWAALWQLPRVQGLRQIWVQQYYRSERPAAVRWRPAEELPPAALRIYSPTEPEARFCWRESGSWLGYKAHLTETCDPDAPLLITDVQTTPAPVPDTEVLPQIQANLAARDRLPARQYADGGYTTAAAYVVSEQEYGIELVGPAEADPSWQAREGTGFASGAFQIDWEAQAVRCPQGQRSAGWKETQKHGRPVVQVHFAAAACQACASRPHCTKSERAGRRLTLRPQAEYEALQHARSQRDTAAFQELYARRAGIEGTHHQAIATCDLRQCRYRGLAKTHLQHLLTATALNLLRVAEWLRGTPRAQTRVSKVHRLLAVPA